MIFVNYLRAQPLYEQLVNVYQTVEGNILERGNERTVEAQIEALRYALYVARPRGLLETGTNKSLFGYVLSHIAREVTLHTFDGDPRCIAGVELLNRSQACVRSSFTLGDTKTTLTSFAEKGLGFAWVDGGHDEATARSDLNHAMRLAIPLIGVDDTRTMPEVRTAVQAALAEHTEYAFFPNPFYEFDDRGMVFLKRT